MADLSRRFTGEIESVDDRAVYGWICDRHDSAKAPFLTLFERGCPVEVARPTIYRPDIAVTHEAKRSVGFAVRRRNRKETFCIAAPDGTRLDLNPNSDDLSWLLDRSARDLPAPITFLHIQNSMGTSIRNALDQGRLSPIDVLFVYPHGLGVTIEDFFGVPALTLARSRLIFGHLLFGIHEHLPQHGRYRTVLRCPVERLISNVIRVSTEGSGLQEAVASFIQLEALEFDNYQTRVFFGAHIPFGAVKAEHVVVAASNAEYWFDKIGFADSLGTVRATLAEFIDPALLGDDHSSNYDRPAALQAFTQGPARERLRAAVASDVYLYCTICSRRGHPIRNAGLYATLGLI